MNIHQTRLSNATLWVLCNQHVDWSNYESIMLTASELIMWLNTTTARNMS